MSTVRADLIVASDIHLSHTPPRAREGRGDWYEQMARPLDILGEMVKTINGDGREPVVVYAGDIFDQWNAPAKLINFAIDHLPYGFAIPGQHDLPNHNYHAITSSAYWTLVRAGKLRDIDPERNPLCVGQYQLWGFPWGWDVDAPHCGPLCKQVAIIHRYIWRRGCSYEGADRDSMVVRWRADLEQSGYDYAFFGDNHKGFLSQGKIPICNCGAFMRRNVDECDYVPCVGVLYDDGSVARVPLGVEEDVARAVKAVTPGSVCMELAEVLRGVRQDATDYPEAVKRELDRRKSSDRVRELVMEALEDGR